MKEGDRAEGGGQGTCREEVSGEERSRGREKGYRGRETKIKGVGQRGSEGVRTSVERNWIRRRGKEIWGRVRWSGR